jgi:hypothetical protein
MYVCMYVCMYGWMDGWIDRWMGPTLAPKWLDEFCLYSVYKNTRHRSLPCKYEHSSSKNCSPPPPRKLRFFESDSDYILVNYGDNIPQ